ncbi:hypothetical protein QTO34_011165 [Cnephaeus nilssonii]|uniref:Disintegrin and metalloproteinase domain-containing protein 30 n=1 Tax=Cnephaeus nilssonii TaxID=3371016 RepID=A0AA40LEF5_CNENI|nr:hypothetical protein QTO34_011165 [Eptesicus nilssonii]
MRSVRASVSQGQLLPVLVLALLLVDSLGEDSHFHPEWGSDSYEITIPRKLGFRGGEQGVTKRMSYLLQVQGRKHVLHLWPKRLLLPRHLQVFSYTEQGALVEDHPYIPRDCSYAGVVEGAEGSEATLSTCAGGLRGILKIDANITKWSPSGPLPDEGEFQDRISGFSDEQEEQMAQPDIMARRSDFADSFKHQRYLELAMVFDHEDTSYRRRVLNALIPADWAHIYIKGNFSDRNASHWGKVCGMGFVASACAIPDKNLLLPATWTAHEIGHSVGMEHDTQYCQCRGKHSCIMGTGRSGFSNCSYNHYINYVRQRAMCLTDIPGLGYVVKKCGNKIVEDDEECDCGSKEDCEEDHCCKPDCKFQRGATCSTGLCCHKCHFRPLEYCNGTSSVCPDDTYKHDGTPCKYDARCFRKGCWSTYMQCQHIFGSDAREAPAQCYEAVNLIGDQYGNCGVISVGNYKQCTKQNSLCGRVQCINVPTLPDLPDHTSVVATHLQSENLLCWGLGYHLAMVSMGIPDLGVIHDGTSCGEDRICWNRTCVETSILKVGCVPENCNDRGFCNNNRNCHCVNGWAPPFCEEEGYGGSVDSGSPRRLEEEVPASFQIVYLLMLRIVLFAISVAFVLLRAPIGDLLNLK